jgi:hypothetical protein
MAIRRKAARARRKSGQTRKPFPTFHVAGDPEIERRQTPLPDFSPHRRSLADIFRVRASRCYCANQACVFESAARRRESLQPQGKNALRHAALVVLAITVAAPTALAQKLIPVEKSKQDINCPFGQRDVCRKRVEETATKYCIDLKYKSGWPARLVQLEEVWTLLAVLCE